MDRDKRWDRLEVAWKMLTRGEGKLVDDLAAAVERGYTAAKPLTDEFVMPLLRKGPDGEPRAVFKDGDACFFYNFRADRARQLTLALHAADADFPHFDRAPRPKLAAFATHDPVRREVRRAGGLPAPEPGDDPRRGAGEARRVAAAHRRDGEVRARDLLLQRRRRAGVPGEERR